MTDRLMIYGATGFVGKLLANAARHAGLSPLLAGRDGGKLLAVSASLGLDAKSVNLNNKKTLDEALSNVDVVLNAAGPFVNTAAPLIEACLRTGTHYLDLNSEIDVFEQALTYDQEAKRQRLMVMPGCGFDVVPSDCLAAHLASHLPNAARLSLYFSGSGGTSRGTIRTLISNLGQGTAVRRDGKIVSLRRAPTKMVDFGKGPQESIAVGWGDVSTAFHSTKIPNIEVYFAATKQLVQMRNLMNRFGWLVKTRPLQRYLTSGLENGPEGPSEEDIAAGSSLLIGEVESSQGRRVKARLRTPESHRVTIMTATDIAQRVLSGEIFPGFQTPSRAFGADYILGFDGVTRDDLAIEGGETQASA